MIGDENEMRSVESWVHCLYRIGGKARKLNEMMKKKLDNNKAETSNKDLCVRKVHTESGSEVLRALTI